MPEPETLGLMGSGLGLLVGVNRKLSALLKGVLNFPDTP
ncbi:MAG: hypothetical protein DMG72_13015 [Acidobacteria bacterium]|nr:MAG: hypothetical protein DMG72_13015 [Acidobacteriota bacterium]